ncbi:MAG: ABC transporter substrate-binding protein [Dehalococcoidia bacterium]
MLKARKLYLGLAILSILALVMAACGEDEAKIPELADGKLQAGSDITWAPFEFFEEGTTTPTGFDVELFNAIGAKMGVEVEWVNTGFDGIIPALEAQRFDVIVSGMTHTAKRDEVIDFVDYYFAGITLIVPKGNPKNIHSMDDLSGLSVAAVLGTTWQDLLDAQNQTFAAQGKSPIDIVLFDTDPEAIDQLRIGRVDADMNDNPVADYIVSLDPDVFESLSGEILLEAAPFGWGVRESSTELKEALEDAIRQLIADGSYQRIIEKWGLGGGTITGRGIYD